MLGKIDGERRSRSEDEMVRQPHQLNGQESEQTLGDGGEQRSLMYCFGGLQKVRPDKVMAPYSSTLAWQIPWMEEEQIPGRLQSMGSRRVGHD